MERKRVRNMLLWKVQMRKPLKRLAALILL